MQAIASLNNLTHAQIFLFLLPVLVVVAAFIGDWWKKRRDRRGDEE